MWIRLISILLISSCLISLYLYGNPALFLQPRYQTHVRRYMGDGSLRPTETSVVLPNWLEHGLSAWSPGAFPLVVSPASPPSLRRPWTLDQLVSWAADHREMLRAHLLAYGAILFRGFPVSSSGDFERLSMALAPELEGEFFHSTPRSRFNESAVVHTASDDPPWMVIPPHCERCWIKNAPRVILFFAQVPNAGSGGETPLTDFQGVWQQMDPLIRAQFVEKGGLKYRRQFFDETRGFRDFFKTFSWPIPVSWQRMFESSSLDAVDARRKALGFEVTWVDGEAGIGIVEANSVMPAAEKHPETQAEVWHNHLHLLHADSTAAEYAFSAQHQASWLYLALHYAARSAAALNAAMFGERYVGQTVLFADGSAIPQEVMDHVRHLVWNNTLVYSHQAGDVVFVDNHRLAHSRQPFSGFRRILTCWA